VEQYGRSMWQWVETVSVELGRWWAYCPDPRWYMSEYGAALEWYWQVQTKEVGENSVKAPLRMNCPSANTDLCCEKPGTTRLSWLSPSWRDTQLHRDANKHLIPWTASRLSWGRHKNWWRYCRPSLFPTTAASGAGCFMAACFTDQEARHKCQKSWWG
jgi:hypothetical protein